MKKNPSIMTISELSEPSRHDDDDHQQDYLLDSDPYEMQKSQNKTKHEYPRTCPTEQDAFQHTQNSGEDFQEEYRKFESMIDYEEELIEDNVGKQASVEIDIYNAQKQMSQLQMLKVYFLLI